MRPGRSWDAPRDHRMHPEIIGCAKRSRHAHGDLCVLIEISVRPWIRQGTHHLAPHSGPERSSRRAAHLATHSRPERQRRAGTYSAGSAPQAFVATRDLDVAAMRVGPGSAALRALSGDATGGSWDAPRDHRMREQISACPRRSRRARGSGTERTISHRIPGRSDSGEPGPTRSSTCRKSSRPPRS